MLLWFGCALLLSCSFYCCLPFLFFSFSFFHPTFYARKISLITSSCWRFPSYWRITEEKKLYWYFHLLIIFVCLFFELDRFVFYSTWIRNSSVVWKVKQKTDWFRLTFHRTKNCFIFGLCIFVTQQCIWENMRQSFEFKVATFFRMNWNKEERQNLANFKILFGGNTIQRKGTIYDFVSRTIGP